MFIIEGKDKGGGVQVFLILWTCHLREMGEQILSERRTVQSDSTFSFDLNKKHN